MQIGDLVWAYNFESGEKELCKVKEVFVNETDMLVHITVNDEVINTTVGHPFYVKDKGWTLAEDLNVGDTLLLIDGSEDVIENVKIEHFEKPIKVYNFDE